MGLERLLSRQDVEDIRLFVYSYSGTEMGPIDRVFGTWSENKVDLYRLLGNKLRYTFDVEVRSSQDVVANDLDEYLGDFPSLCGLSADVIWTYVIRSSKSVLCHLYETVIQHIYDSYVENERDMRNAYRCASSIFKLDNIKSNIMEDEAVFKELRVPKGTKTMKAIRRFLESIEYDQWDVFESFKDDVSAIRTPCSTSTRTITLSIHPADFITMSDNDCDWRSCFSWESGEHSNSTIEAMNSKNVLVAYIQNTERPMMEWYDTIPNKSWRSMEVVDMDNHQVIVTGKGYPYRADEIQKAILDELYRLCDSKVEKNVYEFDADDYFANMVTYGMYNDWEDSDANFFVQSLNDIESIPSVQVSGPQTCMMCGRLVTDDPSVKDDIVGGTQKVCRKCYDRYHCDVCNINHLDKKMIKVRMLTGDGIISWKNACVDALKREYFYIRSLDLYIDRTVYIFSPEVAVFHGDMSWMDDPQFEDVRSFRLLTQKAKQRYDEAKIEYIPVKRCYLGQLLSEPIEANRLLDRPLEKMYNGEDRSGVRLNTRPDQLRMFLHDYNNFTEVIDPEDRYMHFRTVRVTE